MFYCAFICFNSSYILFFHGASCPAHSYRSLTSVKITFPLSLRKAKEG